MLLSSSPPSYQKSHQFESPFEDMINNNANNPDQQGDRENADYRSGLSMGLPQGAFLASLLGPVQADSPPANNATDHTNNPSMCVSAAPSGSQAADQMQSVLFGRLDAQNLQASQHLSTDMGAFNAAASVHNQSSSQNESIIGLYNQPKQNLTNMDQVFGGMSNGTAAAEFRAFFGSGNAQGMGGNVSSNTNSAAGGLARANSNVQSSLSGLGQQSANVHSLSGNLPVQNTLHFNNVISLSSAQDTLMSQMNLHNALANSWQQQHQIQQPLQLQHQQQLQQQQQQLQQPLEQSLQLQQQPQHQIGDAAWGDVASLEGPPQLPPEIKWKGRGRSSTFPLKLHQMLLDLEKQEGGTAIASFLPHGRGFQIHKPKEFSKEIMPNYFRMSTYSSFQRQLNLYDFQRIAEGHEKGAYWHELFLRDQPMSSTNMKRSKVKGATRARQDERLKNYERQKDRFHR